LLGGIQSCIFSRNGFDKTIGNEHDKRTELLIIEPLGNIYSAFDKNAFAHLEHVLVITRDITLATTKNIDEIVTGSPVRYFAFGGQALVFDKKKVVDLKLFEQVAIGNKIEDVVHEMPSGFVGKSKLTYVDRGNEVTWSVYLLRLQQQSVHLFQPALKI
jgi:hypothetical protein